MRRGLAGEYRKYACTVVQRMIGFSLEMGVYICWCDKTYGTVVTIAKERWVGRLQVHWAGADSGVYPYVVSLSLRL